MKRYHHRREDRNQKTSKSPPIVREHMTITLSPFREQQYYLRTLQQTEEKNMMSQENRLNEPEQGMLWPPSLNILSLVVRSGRL